MTVNIDWGLSNGAPDPASMVQQGFDLGQKQRDQNNLKRALGVLSADPTDPAARAMAMSIDPQIVPAIDNAAWARQAHQQADAYRVALADKLTAGLPSAAPAPPAPAPAMAVPSGAMAALLGGSMPQPHPIADGSDYGRVDVTAPAAPAPGVSAGKPAPTLAALLGPDSGVSGLSAPPVAAPVAAPALPNLPASAVASAAVPEVAAPTSAPADTPSPRDAALARMIKADPERAMALMETERAQASARRMAQLDLAQKVNETGLGFLATARDQPSYEAAGANYNAFLVQNGLPPVQLPPTYSPETVRGLQMQALTVKDRIAAEREQATLAETHRHNVADEDKTKFAPIKVKNASGGEDVYIYDQASGKFVNSGADGGGKGAGSGSAKPGFDAAMEFILPHEGGYAASDGNGAPVNFGINQGANPGVDVKNLTRDGAKEIYRDKYWGPSGAEKLPENAQTAYFDTYIINPGRAKALWAQSGGDVNKFLDLRDGWLNGLVADNPGKYGRFKKAWTARTNDLRSLVGGDDEESSGGAPAGAPMGKPAIHTEGPANGGLSPEEIHFYAQDVANGGDMPQLGMGKDAATARQAILKEAAKIGMGKGHDGVDFGVTRATSKADREALKTLSRNSAGILAFEKTAKMNGDVALGLAERAGNGGVPVFNRWINAGKTSLAGDPDVAAFHAGIETFANEFAKLTSSATGGGVTSDSARAHVYEMVNRDQSPAQFKATMRVLYRDMENRRVGIEQQRQELLGRIRGASGSSGPPAPPAPAVNIPTMTPDQVRAAPSGTLFRTTDGRTMRKR
jgi:hypothetical protein